MRSRLGAAALPALAILLCVSSCGFDNPFRDVTAALARACNPGTIACHGDDLAECIVNESGDPAWSTLDACASHGLVCVAALERCGSCRPGQTRCEGQDVL